MNNSDTVYWADRIMEPLFESKPESYVAEELAKRLNVDPAAVNTMSDAERTYTSLAGAMYMTDHDTMQYAPLLTITQEDIDELGVEGVPQEGVITVAEFKEKGLYKTKRSFGDKLTNIPYKAFYADPAANPLATSTGKFEIYCPTLSGYVNSSASQRSRLSRNGRSATPNRVREPRPKSTRYCCGLLIRCVAPTRSTTTSRRCARRSRRSAS